MHFRTILSLCGIGLMVGAGGTSQAEPIRPRREISYESEWILYEFQPDIEVHSEAEQEERQRRRIRDDGTGALRDSTRTESPFTARDPMPFMPPGGALTPAQERRSRNWILPSLEDDAASPWHEPEERPTTGWGWLADEVEQRRQVELAEQEQRREEGEENEDSLWRRSVTNGEDESRLPQLGALALDVEPVGQRNNRDDHDLARVAQMNPEELREFVAQQDAMGNEDAFGRVDPWDSGRGSASAWTTSRQDGDLEASGLFAPAELTSDWGGDNQSSLWTADPSPWEARGGGVRAAAATTRGDAFAGERTASRFDSRFGAAFDRGGRDGSGSSLSSIGFAPVESGDGGWSGNWSSGSDWQASPVQGAMSASFGSSTVSEPTSIQRPSASAFPSLHNDGRLSAP